MLPRAQHAGGVGEDVGPALEHEADHAQRGAVTCSTRQPSCSTRSTTSPRAGGGVAPHPRRPAIMSARIAVGERPAGWWSGRAAAASSTSAALAAAIGANTSSSASRRGEGVEEGGDRSSDLARAQCGERVHGRRSAPVGGGVLGGGHVQQVAGLLHDDQPVAGLERRRQLGVDDHATRSPPKGITWPASRRRSGACSVPIAGQSARRAPGCGRMGG